MAWHKPNEGPPAHVHFKQEEILFIIEGLYEVTVGNETAKAGPGSISEAIAMHLPVVVERNAWTLPQERYNTEWILEKQVGVVLPSFRAIDAGLRELLDARNFTRFQANAAAIMNRAVFEIPEILARLLNEAQGEASHARASQPGTP